MATAHGLCAAGADVLLVARDPARLALAASDCADAGISNGGTSAAFAADLRDPSTARRVVAECLDRFDRIDVLVNNAGATSRRPLAGLDDDEWQRQWELNVMAPQRLMTAAAPLMARAGGGRIVTVASASGKRPGLANAAYSVTKSAQLSLSRVFADAYARDGVLVNAIAPGPVATELWMGEGGLADQAAAADGGDRDAAVRAMTDRIPIGRLASAEEIASVVLFLCSSEASNVAGAAWSVDGGYVPAFL